MATRRTVLRGIAASAAFLRAGTAIAADTIKIGFVVTQSGSGVDAGRFESNGAKLAIDQINAGGGVLGRQLELAVEDDQATNPGAVSAFNRLANRGDIDAYYGPSRSTQLLAIEPDIRRVGRVMLMQGQDPKLTHMGNPWLFRATAANSLSSVVIAEAGVNELKKTKWAIVHSTDTFGKSAADNLTAALAKLGVKPVLVQGFAANQSDLTPVILAIKQSGVDIVNTSVALETDVALLLRQMQELGVEVPAIGGTSITSPVTIRLAGAAMTRCYGVTDFDPGSSPEALAFTDQYAKVYKEAPAAGSSFDAMKLISRAITESGGTDPRKMRAALLAVKGYKGVQGVYDFDENGDGLHSLNLVKISDGKTVFMKAVQVTS